MIPLGFGQRKLTQFGPQRSKDKNFFCLCRVSVRVGALMSVELNR
jgi:hypothetical protein